MEYPLLVLGRKPRIQRQDLRLPLGRISGDSLRAKCLGRLVDVPFGGHENEHVATVNPGQFAGRIEDSLLNVHVARLLVRFHGPVADFDRVGTAGDFKNGGRAVLGSEMLREAACVDRGRGDDHLQVGAAAGGSSGTQ